MKGKTDCIERYNVQYAAGEKNSGDLVESTQKHLPFYEAGEMSCFIRVFSLIWWHTCLE